MKKSALSFLSLMLALIMLMGTFAACSPDEEETSGTDAPTSSENATESNADSEDSSTEDGTESGSDVNSETDSDSETESEPDVDASADGLYGPSITTANQLANGVQTYYTSGKRENYKINNLNMSLDYTLKLNGDNQLLVNAISNSHGKSYITETMDVFIRMKDGNTYYASNSSTTARANIFRIGYYYYDVHFVGQTFRANYNIFAEKDIDAKLFKDENGFSSNKYKNGELYCRTSSSNAYIVMHSEDFNFSASEYNALQLSIKAPSGSTGKVYYIAGEEQGHTEEQSVGFTLNSDGEYHTYIIPLNEGEGYEGNVHSLRVDVNGTTVGDLFNFKDFKLLKVDSNAPNIVLDRTFHTYSDKLHQELHFVAKEDTENIDALGMITNISADTVDKMIVKADGKVYTSISEVKDWATAEYVAFDIKETGIFGYILANHKESGAIKVTLSDGIYSIVQEATPEDGTIFAPTDSTEDDYFMGHRIYTDENHTFDAFISEADFERNPSIGISSGNYVDYDALRGAFTFTIGGIGFNPPYYFQWNKHYSTDVTVKTREDRKIYVRTITSAGTLEGAALLDGDGMLLPVPLEVSKNFGSEDEEPIFYCGDNAYGETVFPLNVKAENQYKFTVLNVYQNWGNYPIKQLSSIQYYAPYYHLSTGVTESSCIAPWYNDHGRNLWTLPDFRSMSAPLWANQPQHSHGGYHYFLQYTDSDGNYNASENYSNVIGSSGLSYSEVLMSYISDDGKIKVDYNHIEFPQFDEMRAYYEINYEVLEDVSFNDFRSDFSFYSCKCYGGTFTKMGYLNEKNEIVHTDAANDKEPAYFVLGDESPYVSFYGIELNKKEDSWVNIGYVIAGSDITIGGEKYDGNFSLMCKNKQYYLSLDLGETTLKKGDKMTINMIIVPWGHPESVDDKSMQNVREDSCLNPLSVDVIKGEKIESTFVPRVKTDDGKSAEFTLKGGADNVAVRVYGFDKLTSPKIYEKINGKWEEYKVSSIGNPDLIGYENYYDGYFVYFDDDGTYSYTFVTNMTEKSEDGTVTHLGERTFKIVAEEDFVPWPKKDDLVKNEGPMNIFLAPSDLLLYTNNGSISGVGTAEISKDASYVKFTGDEDNVAEVYYTIFSQDKSNSMISTGQYIVIKYRYPSTNTKISAFEFYIASHNGSTGGKHTGTGDHVAFAPKNDDQWHVAIIDLETNPIPAYVKSDDGNYYVSSLRFDMFNGDLGVDDYVEIAYVGMTDDLQKLYDYDSDAKDIAYNIKSSSGSTSTPTTPSGPTTFIDPDSDYHKSDKAYGAGIDYINGLGMAGASAPFAGKAASTNGGPCVILHNASTVKGTFILCFAGWNLVESGIEKYVWSADGGKTWHDAEFYNREKFGDPSKDIITAANARAGKDLTEFSAGTSFQGATGSPSGIAADLEAYKGKNIDVTFAAVPKDDPMGLCLVLHVMDVAVPDEKGNVEIKEYAGTTSPYIDADSGYLSASVP